ncbi:mRNA cap guanine-N7 methyltransferase [Tulasnella sp. 419]|nr:mRNA cap guanine-N7 methyltransferase [Tulasnella sp. 419]
MPAFDPVRDAVANSPLNTSFPLPSPHNTPASAFPFPPSSSPPTSSTATSATSTIPTPPVKRLSTLSMLLNDDQIPPPSKKPRIASLLSPAEPHSPLPSTSDHRPGSSSSSSSRQFTSSPLIHSTTSSPRHSPTMPPPSHQPAPFPKPTRIPYNPRRITPANSVLRPLTYEEANAFVSQNKLRFIDRPGQKPTAEKRARGSENGPAPREYDYDRPAKRLKDAGLVAQHYNARPDVGIDKRQESPIIGLKSFNNWIKSVLIAKYAARAFQGSTSRSHQEQHRVFRGPMLAGKVLDMGCGKGGDLQKWSKAKVAEYVGLDVASVSVDQAYQRWKDMQSRNMGMFNGTFAALDCYNRPVTDVLSPKLLSKPFDVVSMQFCMHYAFDTEHRVKTMLGNVSRYLRPGGIFIGTIPNADLLMERLDAIPSEAEELSFGNSIYTIKFDSRQKTTYGQRYSFFLKDAVEDVPEYVVHWDNFVELAAEYGLVVKSKQQFHEVYEENHNHREFRPLLQKMKVIDENGESHMDEDQWEAANIYVAFAFEKQ